MLAFGSPRGAAGEPYSRTASLETALPTVAPSTFLHVHSFRPEVRPRAALDLVYQRRPLVVVVASPDPFGREVPVLGDWLTASLGGDVEVHRGLRLGAGVPLSLRLSGTGVAGVAALEGYDGDAVGIGDPELRGSLLFTRGALRAGAVQRVTLPVGQSGSFLAHGSARYAPSLALAGDLGVSTWAVELGARLRRSESFGDVRFGSEALVAAGLAVRLGAGIALGSECIVLPALARDETRTTDGTVALRRVATELMGWLAWQREGARAVLGIGTSLPLTERASGSDVETLSGPPGEALRIALRLEQAF